MWDLYEYIATDLARALQELTHVIHVRATEEE